MPKSVTNTNIICTKFKISANKNAASTVAVKGCMVTQHPRLAKVHE